MFSISMGTGLLEETREADTIWDRCYASQSTSTGRPQKDDFC